MLTGWPVSYRSRIVAVAQLFLDEDPSGPMKSCSIAAAILSDAHATWKQALAVRWLALICVGSSFLPWLISIVKFSIIHDQISRAVL